MAVTLCKLYAESKLGVIYNTYILVSEIQLLIIIKTILHLSTKINSKCVKLVAFKNTSRILVNNFEKTLTSKFVSSQLEKKPAIHQIDNFTIVVL